MEDAGLESPEYKVTPNTVVLTLRNSADARAAHRNKASNKASSDALVGFEEIREQLDDVEKGILTFFKENGKASRSELEKYTQKSRGTVINRLKKLIERGIIKVNGDIHNPTCAFELP